MRKVGDVRRAAFQRDETAERGQDRIVAFCRQQPPQAKRAEHRRCVFATLRADRRRDLSTASSARTWASTAASTATRGSRLFFATADLSKQKGRLWLGRRLDPGRAAPKPGQRRPVAAARAPVSVLRWLKLLPPCAGLRIVAASSRFSRQPLFSGAFFSDSLMPPSSLSRSPCPSSPAFPASSD